MKHKRNGDKKPASDDVTNDDDVEDADDTTMNLSRTTEEFVIWAHKKALECVLYFIFL